MQIESFNNKFATVMVTPYQTARGRLVSFVPQSNNATINVNGKLVRGECLSPNLAEQSDQERACA